ncbi:potassium voltage-dependent transporter [Moniliophthora roreri]|nr:potassium voltage-dependent transporter [Moniliophthora roreri]
MHLWRSLDGGFYAMFSANWRFFLDGVFVFGCGVVVNYAAHVIGIFGRRVFPLIGLSSGVVGAFQHPTFGHVFDQKSFGPYFDNSICKQLPVDHYRTVVHNVLVGSVSFASPGAKALHNASTAQEITIISPAPELEFRRWHDPSPMPPSPIPPALRTVPATLSLRSPTLSPLPSSERSPSPTEEPPLSPTSSAASPKPAPQSSVAKLIADNSPSGINYPTPPVQSSRTALILNRFSRECTIMYCSNDHLIDPPDKDEQVKQWIDTVKSWGVNERGQPSDGGFGFGRFGLVRRGKATKKEPTSPPRPGRGHRTHSTSHIARSRAHSSPLHSQRGVDREREREKHADGEGEIISVDAIFSAHSDGLMVILRRAV